MSGIHQFSIWLLLSGLLLAKGQVDKVWKKENQMELANGTHLPTMKVEKSSKSLEAKEGPRISAAHRFKPLVGVPLFSESGALLANFVTVETLNAEDGVEEDQLFRPQNYRTKRTDGNIAEQLSKNITKILENLLKDYDKTERPSFKKGEATNVKINILIRSMGPISEEEMNYSMDCYFRQYWRDERLSFTGLKNTAHHFQTDQLSLNVKMLEKIWKPDTYFHNGLSSYLHTITRPNKLLRISEHGDITYSMRLTIKARCPMMLQSFPMDWQACLLIVGSFAYRSDEVVYVWKSPDTAVGYEGKLELSQFDIMQTAFRSLNYSRGNNMGTFSVLQVVMTLQRHTGYFLIQIYLPCTLLVILSWVGFWINREATADRVSLGITTVLTLSTIALESRTSLPKVHYATALDWFIICSFGYCIATLLEFAGVHYFTKVGSGDISLMDDTMDDLKSEEEDDEEDEEEEEGQDDEDEEWQDLEVSEEFGCLSPLFSDHDDYNQDVSYVCYDDRRSFEDRHILYCGPHCPLAATIPNSRSDSKLTEIFAQRPRCYFADFHHRDNIRDSSCLKTYVIPSPPPPPRVRTISTLVSQATSNGRQRQPGYPAPKIQAAANHWQNHLRQAQTQTSKKISCAKQFLYCLLANKTYRKQRQMEAVKFGSTNSTSKIDSIARILFPVSFALFNVTYWYSYLQSQKPFSWDDHTLKGNVL